MSDLAARKAALYARFSANREESEAIGRELTELEQLYAARHEAPPLPPSPASPAPEPLDDDASAAWGRAAVLRALKAGRLDLVEDLAGWERGLRTPDAAEWLAEITHRTGVPARELLDVLHRFRCDVRLTDPTRPFFQRGAAKRFATVPRLLQRAAREVDTWRGLWQPLFREHLRAAAELVVAGQAPAKGEPDPVDRLVIQMLTTGSLIEYADANAGATRIVAALPIEVERVRVTLGAFAALAGRFDPHRARLADDGRPLLARKGHGPESSHVLAQIRRLEKALGARTGGVLTQEQLAVCVALALPERYGKQLGPDADPVEWLRQLRKRARQRGGKPKPPGPRRGGRKSP